MSLERTVKWIDKTGTPTPHHRREGQVLQSHPVCLQVLETSTRNQWQQRSSQEIRISLRYSSDHSANMRDARKLFRLFKTVNEAKKVQDLLRQDLSVDSILNIGVRAFFGVYWLFDNLNILSKIKLLAYDSKEMAKWGARFWLLALLTNLVLLVKQLLSNLSQTTELKKYECENEECTTLLPLRARQKRERRSSLSS